MTKDGSHTVAIAERRLTYHSVHGAVQESLHVFIEAGLNYALSQKSSEEISVFEMGFGTGLNAFLTAIKAIETNQPVYYAAVEAFPLNAEEARMLNYAGTFGYPSLFESLHQSPWNEDIELHERFTVQKHQTALSAFHTSRQFDVIYYDAFAPSAQPELWTVDVFTKLHGLLKPGGCLVTYCSKSDVRRAMQGAGFTVKKLPGPLGKREMLRAEKV